MFTKIIFYRLYPFNKVFHSNFFNMNFDNMNAFQVQKYNASY